VVDFKFGITEHFSLALIRLRRYKQILVEATATHGDTHVSSLVTKLAITDKLAVFLSRKNVPVLLLREFSHTTGHLID